MHDLYLSLGSNLGQRDALLRQAIRLLEERVGMVERQSDFIQTEPWGFTSPNLFLNACVLVRTELSPLECLHLTQQIEHEMGRTVKSKGGRYHDRPIDIDLLMYDDLHIQTAELTLPHPHMHERDFVMIPLKQILP